MSLGDIHFDELFRGVFRDAVSDHLITSLFIGNWNKMQIWQWQCL